MFGKREIDPKPSTHYRSERVSSVNGQYYFATREGTLEGPYFTRDDAERQTDLYVDRMMQAKAIQKHQSQVHM